MNRSKARLSATTLLAVLSFLLATTSFWINYTHHVSLLGGGDEGSYIACGKLMSERLAFIYGDAVAEFGKKYLPASNFTVTGFRIHNEAHSPVEMVSGWNKGFSLLAIPFWWLDEDGGWKYLNPLAGALSLLLIFFIGVRLKGPFVGFSAASLLATNFLQIWFSRYPMTEVVSQCLLLGMFLCVLGYYKSLGRAWVYLFGLLSAVSLLLHFGNAPLWCLLSGALCLIAAPVERKREMASEPTTTLPHLVTGWSFVPPKLKRFLSVVVVTGFVPGAVALVYWLLDPGVQRYTRLGKKMARSTGQLEQLVTATLVRLENLALFVPVPVWCLLAVGLFLVVRGQLASRMGWLLLVALGVLSFLVIISTGVGTPRVLYVARRNVPMVLPVIFLVSALALDWLAGAFRRAGVGRSLAMIILASSAGLQLASFAPFADVDQGKGAPEIASRVRAELASTRTDAPQLVIVPQAAASFKGGMRYVYGIPVVTYSAALTPEKIGEMVDDGVNLYLLDIHQSLFEKFQGYTDLKPVFITSRTFVWSHINPIGPTSFPKITDRLSSRVDLYRIIRRKTPAAPPPPLP